MTQEESNDIKRYFDVVVENLRSDFRLVADCVAMNAERLDRLGGTVDHFEGELHIFRDETRHNFVELFRFRDETRHNFVELRSMLKPSNAELDRRVTKLEGRYGGR